MTIETYTSTALLVWSGTLGSAEDEIFSYHRFAGYGGPGVLADIADDASNDVTHLLAQTTTGGFVATTIGQAFPTSVKWTQLKAYNFIEATGEIDGEPEVRVLTDHGTGTGLPSLTHQDALAITTQKLPHDKRSRNRFYLPTMMAFVLTSTGHVVGTFIDDIQNQLKFENNEHLASAVPWTYGVYSPTSHFIGVIDRYYTGDVMDTIRRRRNKLVESRHALAG